jgi:hypothetical protein
MHTMLGLQELLAELEYDQSPYYRQHESQFEPETVHLFRAARNIDVNGRIDGIYVFETSPDSQKKLLSPQPAVYIATAQTEDDARKIHRTLWNLCYAPFLIVTLPHQIRIYTGFSYSPTSETEGLLAPPLDTVDRLHILKEFAATSINFGQIWRSAYGQKLNPDQRVDKQLLKNLQKLGDLLVKHNLNRETAHALIGKYVYFSYLRHRSILSDEWLAQQGIQPETVLTHKATVASLQQLSIALEERFNGQIFPIDFESVTSLEDKHVSWVASVFVGDKVEDTPEVVRQLHLPFRAYDFNYIPVETLSAIYEQFIHERKKKGAIYTPEVLADYLLSEMEWAKPLEKGMRILDPACGSGVFLVLAYRRLIEKEMAEQGRVLRPEELRQLLDNIYGIEKERDACFVTEFSLILTLLHYVEPRELHKNRTFQFPALHNQQIYHQDFFTDDIDHLFEEKFDWIIGNPPWLVASQKEQPLANRWIKQQAKTCPVGNKSVAEAFSWRVGQFLKADGLMGLIMPATSLVNLKSRLYRQRFFAEHDVLRITNFANLRDVLFDKRGAFPAATLIYRRADQGDKPPPIVHYSPFAINQVVNGRKRPWVLTINESEIKTIDITEVDPGETSTWKLALWGTQQDKRALERLPYLFPFTLESFCKKHGFGSDLPKQGIELRNAPDSTDKTTYMPELTDLKRFNTTKYNNLPIRPRFFVDAVLLEEHGDLYLRRGKGSLHINKAPHIILSKGWKFIIYSERDFIIPPQQMGIAIPDGDSGQIIYLKALAAYLNTSLVSYYLFFNVPEWGVFRQRKSVVTSEVRKIPTPDISWEQARAMANLYDELATYEQKEIQQFAARLHHTQSQLTVNGNPSAIGWPDTLSKSDEASVSQFAEELETKLQNWLDEQIKEILDLPDALHLLAREFVNTRLALDTPSAMTKVIAPPGPNNLLLYAQTLRDILDNFTMGTAYHRVKIIYSEDLIECEVEIVHQSEPYPLSEDDIQPGHLTIAEQLQALKSNLQESFSQWIYIQRGLRFFDGPRVYIYKPARLIDWTRTQALEDAQDIIGSVLISA